MFDLDSLIDTAVINGQIASGVNVKTVLSRVKNNGASGRVVTAVAAKARAVAANQRAAVWSPEEEAFLRDNLGHLSTEEIARHLGRTPAAIKIRWTRKGYEAPSKRSGEMVATQIGKRMGVCGKLIIRLVDRSVLPGRVVPGGRNIHVVREDDLRRWIVRPQNWIYFKAERINDLHLKRLVEYAQARWPDEWWTTGQVAAYHGVNFRTVNKAIHDGRLPAVRWQNWRILKSDAAAMSFVRGKGNVTLDWSPAGDAFMVLARAVGLTADFIDDLRGDGSDKKRAHHRLKYMHSRGMIPLTIKRFGLHVEYDRENGRLWADWREYDSRFPGLVKAIDKFLHGGRMSQLDRTSVRGVLWSWTAWRAETPEQKQMARRLKYSQSASAAHLWEAYQTVLSWELGDPLGMNHEERN
ncbi:MAG: helix-turn-helix domain-containing protein [Chloroflexi bacterium]|nr:helix-turn-helix domain-containing protein [Chloroflexota bacterium]